MTRANVQRKILIGELQLEINAADSIFLTFKSVLDVPINDVDRSGAVDPDGQEGEGDWQRRPEGDRDGLTAGVDQDQSRVVGFLSGCGQHPEGHKSQRVDDLHGRL